ncbi:small EDRK-rich factor 2 [Sigmodon hispidus]
MTRGNQPEFTKKLMKKQSKSVKGKAEMMGFLLPPAAEDSGIMQQKQKKANEKKEKPRVAM